MEDDKEIFRRRLSLYVRHDDTYDDRHLVYRVEFLVPRNVRTEFSDDYDIDDEFEFL